MLFWRYDRAAHGKAFLQFSGKDEHGFDLPSRGGGYRAGVRIADVLEAVKLAPEKVRAFLDAILTRTRQTRQHDQPSRRKSQDMEL